MLFSSRWFIDNNLELNQIMAWGWINDGIVHSSIYASINLSKMIRVKAIAVHPSWKLKLTETLVQYLDRLFGALGFPWWIQYGRATVFSFLRESQYFYI